MGIPFFGIGAMRAGTTWLSGLLHGYPDCSVTPIKELHFFDTRYGVHSQASSYLDKARKLSQQASKLQERVKALFAKAGENGHLREDDEHDDSNDEDDEDLERDVLETGNYTCWTDEVRRRFHEQARIEARIRRLEALQDFFSIRDLESYVDYMTRNSCGTAAFGEITPSYALLPSRAFAEMDGALPGARYIFIMRDPVDRLWSQVRYAAQRSKYPEKKPNRLFRKALQYPEFVGRSGYQRTITELERVIPPARILYLFFETLVSPETGPAEIRRIESVLGLQRRETEPERFITPTNASREDELIPKNEVAAVQLLVPEYKFVSERFGIPSGWRRPDF